MNWYTAAILSAIFASVTSILAKIGLKDIDSNLATAVRTTVAFIFTWGIVIAQGTEAKLLSIGRHALLFLILSGIVTGLSWLFYFRALQIGDVHKVVPIDKLSLVLTIIFATLILREKITLLTALGGIFMTVGAILIAFAK